MRREAMTETATLTRMILPDHTCPFGVRAKEMLAAAGFTVDDRILSTRDEVDAFAAQGVIGGRSVPCLTAEFQVRSHTGYELDSDDFHDTSQLCERFAIALPTEYERFVTAQPGDDP